MASIYGTHADFKHPSSQQLRTASISQLWRPRAVSFSPLPLSKKHLKLYWHADIA